MLGDVSLLIGKLLNYIYTLLTCMDITLLLLQENFITASNKCHSSYAFFRVTIVEDVSICSRVLPQYE